MKCKFCKYNGHEMAFWADGVCAGCGSKIINAAIANGYAIANGVVTMPNPDYCDCGASPCFNNGNPERVTHLDYCKNYRIPATGAAEGEGK
jgi:hypothetical protein